MMAGKALMNGEAEYPRGVVELDHEHSFLNFVAAADMGVSSGIPNPD
jgi:hypothetical protein